MIGEGIDYSRIIRRYHINFRYDFSCRIISSHGYPFNFSVAESVFYFLGSK